MATYESGDRFGGRFDPATSLGALLAVFVAFLASAVVLLWLSPVRATVGSVRLLPDAIPLSTAGVDPAAVLVAVDTGLARIYVTGVPAVLLLAGALFSLLGGGRTWTLGVGTACGVLAAGTLTVLTGCHCGPGSTTMLWQSAASVAPIALAPATALVPVAALIGSV
ncbi:hypothetical protein BRD01_06485 [Halobacteriales archaeon QS_8_65_32]|nr:MAG: hypothetical protein BRD01_06485 [Halobacteriales archaeon QS_8_65_32]